jgi:hypothetical protein
MMRNGMSETGAKRDSFGFGHRPEDIEADGFGNVVKKENADMTVE